MRHRKRKNLFLLGMTGLAGAMLVTAGTFSLFSASASTVSDPFTVGTIQIQTWEGDSCLPPTPSSSPGESQKKPPFYLVPGKEHSETFTVENTGMLDEWIGVLANLPKDLPIRVEYAVDVYPPDPADSSSSEPDSNGDVHSNCHTGSKYRGAGGEDKNGQEQGQGNGQGNGQNPDTPWYHGSVDWFTSSDTKPALPFELPVGYHAHITYTYQLDEKADPSFQGRGGALNFDVWAVQYRNNVDGKIPISWDPQPGQSEQVAIQ